MSSILLADNGVSSGAAGLKSSADGTGTLALQTTTASGTATTAVLIDNAQNVGVGVTPSAWVSYEKSIDIGGAGNYGSLSSRGNYVSVGLNYYLNGSSVETYKNTNPAAKYTQSGGNHSWYTAASGTAGNAITFTQAMTLDASGNLCHGVTSVFNGGKYSQFANLNGGQINITLVDTGTTGGTYIGFYNSVGAQAGVITHNGTTTVNYGTSSDYRMKEISGSVEGYKERLMALQPKQGVWKSDNSKFRGFLAHEFALSYPSSVIGEKDAVDEKGDPKYQSMQASTSEVMADLVALVQEQQSLIQSLTDRLTALEGAAK